MLKPRKSLPNVRLPINWTHTLICFATYGVGAWISISVIYHLLRSACH